MSPIKEMKFFGNREKPQLKFFERQLAMEDVKATFLNETNTKRINLLNERLTIRGDIERYKSFFQNRLNDEVAYGEISPSYAYMKRDELLDIRNHFPECRFIFIMRNPVDRAWSQMRFSHVKDSASQLQLKALKRLRTRPYTRRTNYKFTINNLTTVFPPSQIHFIFFEHLFNQSTINNVCDFLGVTHKKAKLGQKKNVAFKSELQSELRREMTKFLKPQYKFVDTFFDGNIPDNWKDDLRSIS